MNVLRWVTIVPCNIALDVDAGKSRATGGDAIRVYEVDERERTKSDRVYEPMHYAAGIDKRAGHLAAIVNSPHKGAGTARRIDCFK